ncbi:hypothetical protein [Halalkalibacterium ligniniphilum]|nr:hypothetical protein [Halalkalibacterium ligniniphilum]
MAQDVLCEVNNESDQGSLSHSFTNRQQACTFCREAVSLKWIKFN